MNNIELEKVGFLTFRCLIKIPAPPLNSKLLSCTKEIKINLSAVCQIP